MKKIFFKKFQIWLVSIAIFLLPFTALAQDPSAQKMTIQVALLIGWIFQILYIFPLGILLGVFLKLMIALTTFDIFVNSNAVILGWVMVRDVANLFFVVILLVIAFATILQFEAYNYKRLLPKLFLMALLINFSKMFAGMIIDLSNVVMDFFAAPFQGAGYAFFLKGLQLDQLLALNTIGTSDAVKNNTQLIPIAAGLIIATIVLSVTFFVVLAFVLILVIRIVAFWILIVLSPLAFLCGVIPATQKYWSQWWQELSKYAIVGPVMAFFLWLGFSLMSGDNDVVKNLQQLEGLGTFENIGSTAGSSLTFLSKYVVVIAFLLVGLKVSQQLGIAGSGLVGSVLGSVKKNMMRYGKLAAIVSGVGGVAFTPGAVSAGIGAVGGKVGGLSGGLIQGGGWLAQGATSLATSFPTVSGLLGGGLLAKRWGKKRGGIIGKAAQGLGWVAGGGLGLAAAGVAGKGILSRATTPDRVKKVVKAGEKIMGVPVLGRFGSYIQKKGLKYNKEESQKALDAVAPFKTNPSAAVAQVKFLEGKLLRTNQEELQLKALKTQNFTSVARGDMSKLMASVDDMDDETLGKAAGDEYTTGFSQLFKHAQTTGDPNAYAAARRVLAAGLKSGKISRYNIGDVTYGFDGRLMKRDPRTGRAKEINDSTSEFENTIGPAVQTSILAAVPRLDPKGESFDTTGGVLRPKFLRGGTAGGALEADPRTASFIDLAREKSVGLGHLSPDELRTHILKNTTDEELGRKGLERQEFETRMRQATPSQLRGEYVRGTEKVLDEETGQVAERTKLGPRGKFAKKILGERKPEKGLVLPQQGVRTGKWGAEGATSLGEDTHGMALSFEELARFLPEDQAKMLSEHKDEEAMNIPEPLKQAYAQAIAKYISLQRAGLEQTKDPKDLAKALEAMGLGVSDAQIKSEVASEMGIRNPDKLYGKKYRELKERMRVRRIEKSEDIEGLNKRKQIGLQKLDTASERLKDSNFVATNPMNLVNADVTSDINRRDQLRHEGGHTTVETMVKNGANLEDEFGRLDPKTQEILTDRIKLKGMDKLTPAEKFEEMLADFHGGASKELRANERELDKTWKFGGAEEEEYLLASKEDGVKTEYGQFMHRDELQKDIDGRRKKLRDDRQLLEMERDEETDPTKRKAIDRDLESLDKEDEKLNERERKLKNNRFTKHDEAVSERDKARDEMHGTEKKGRDSKEYKSARERYEKANDTVEGLSARPGSREEMLRRNRVKEGVAPTPAPQTNLSPEELREVLSGGLPQLGAAATGALVANVVTNMKQEFKLPQVQNRINQQFANRATNNLIGSANDFANPNSPFYMMRILKGLKEGMQKLTQSTEYEKMYDKKERGRIEDTFRNISSLQRTAKKLESKHNLSTDTPNTSGAASDFQVQTLMDAVNDFFKGEGKM